MIVKTLISTFTSAVLLFAIVPNAFADVLSIANTLPDSVTLIVFYKDFDKENSPPIKQYFNILPSQTPQDFSLNEHDRFIGVIDYKFVQVIDADDQLICSKDLASVLPTEQSDITLTITNKKCLWKIKSYHHLYYPNQRAIQ